MKNIIKEFKYLSTSPSVYLAKTTSMESAVCEKFGQKFVDDFTDNVINIYNIKEEVARDEKFILIDTLSEMQGKYNIELP